MTATPDTAALQALLVAKLMERHDVYHASYRDRNSIHCGSDWVQGLADGLHETAEIVRALIAAPVTENEGGV